MKLYLVALFLGASLAHADGLAVDVGGGPIPFSYALAWRDPQGAIAFDISRDKHTCAQVTGAERDPRAADNYIAGTIEQALRPDGKSTTILHRLDFLGSNFIADDPATVSGAPAAGKSVVITLDTTVEERGMSGPFKMTVRGKVTAVGCAAPVCNDLRALPAALPATVEIAGKKLPVRGAELQREGDTRAVILFTGGDMCTLRSDKTARESELIIGMVWQGSKLWKVNLAGRSIGKLHQTDATVAHPPPAPSGEIDLHLATLADGYPIKIEGKVTATPCP